MSLKFISLSMRNFMSYGNNTTVFDLDTPGNILIIGEDLDNTSGGYGGNGTGKSSIVHALVYALYGKSLSNVSKDNLINNINKKNLEVSVDFEKDSKSYRVIRTRRMTEIGTGMRFFMKNKNEERFDDSHELTRDKISNTNILVETAIGIPYELFCRIVVFSPLHMPFLDLPVRHNSVPSQTSFIEELFDLTTLTKRAENLKKETRENVTKLDIKKSRIDALEKEHKRYNDQLRQTESHLVNWEKNNDLAIKELMDKLALVDKIDVKKEKKAHDKASEIEKDINNLLSDKTVFERKTKSITSSIIKKEKEIEHLSDEKCPYCLQKFEDTAGKVSEINTEIKEKRDQVSEYQEATNETNGSIKKLRKRLDGWKEKITVTNIDELVRVLGEYKHIKARVKELKETENPYAITLEELESTELEKIDRESVNELVDLITHQKFLYKLLTKKDSFVRKALLHKNIPYLNQRLRYYLNELGLPHAVCFTHELTASISQFGRDLDFGSLSNGQKARVNLALSLTFRDALIDLHTPLNIIIFDEVLDVGLDSLGVQSAAKLLKKKSRDEKITMFIISHREEMSGSFDKKMMVQMKDGFSHIQHM